MVVVAIEHNWDTIRAHKDVTRNVVELILRDGIEAGEFEPVDPRETAELIMRVDGALLPSDAGRRSACRRGRRRSRGPRLGPLPAARHYPPVIP